MGILDTDMTVDTNMPMESLTRTLYVVVNGTIMVKDSKVLKDIFPGKPIRLPIRK